MHTTPPRLRREELVISEPGNHKTLDALLPDGFVRQIKNLYEGEMSFLLGLGERELKRELRIRGFEPGKRDYILRVQFWVEYDAAQACPVGQKQASMNMSKVIKRVIPKEVFYKHYITDPRRLAWLLSAPQEYKESVEALAMHALDKLHEFVESVKLEKNGFIDTQAVKQLHLVFQSAHHKAELMRGNLSSAGVERGKKIKSRVKEVPIEETPLAETTDEKLARLKAERTQFEAEKKATGIGRENPPVIE